MTEPKLFIQLIDLPNIEGIVVLNLLSWGSGANPWGTAKEEGGFSKPTHYDGLLEVHWCLLLKT